MILFRFLQVFVVFTVFMTSQVGAQMDDSGRPLTPEIATETLIPQTSLAISGQKFMAVTAHPDATKAAYRILEQGGTAADAAIAAQMVLGLVEPQSSGLGGGAFILYYDAAKKQLVTLDGRETAPSTAGPHLFMDEDGKPMRFYDAAIGGRGVGTPSLLKTLEKLHQWQGKTAWADLFYPAIKLAEKGFEVSPRLTQMLMEEKKRFDVDTIAKLYFYPDTVTPIEAGNLKRNPEYAITLRNIARNGTRDFYEGELAQKIVKKVQESKKSRGLLTVEDLQNYTPIERKAICGGYRGYKICSMGQPSSGALTLLMVLGMLERFDLAAWGPDNPKSWHVIAEASRLAFADRNQYMADPDFVKTPDTLLLNPVYLNVRSQHINLDTPMKNVFSGVPLGWKVDQPQAKDNRIKSTGTTHISIKDQYGNIISMTSSIENAFGSRLMVGGFLLNNQLTDFSFKPNDEKMLPIANRVDGGKRPRSSMSPTIIFDPSGEPFMAIGSAGGSRIIGYVLQRIIAMIDWDMELQAAVNMPNIIHRGEKLELETTALKFAIPLKEIGHPVLVGDMNSGLTAIHFKNGLTHGAADPRRDGVALGQ